MAKSKSRSKVKERGVPDLPLPASLPETRPESPATSSEGESSLGDLWADTTGFTGRIEPAQLEVSGLLFSQGEIDCEDC